jgi:hypothetical protein
MAKQVLLIPPDRNRRRRWKTWSLGSVLTKIASSVPLQDLVGVLALSAR